MSDIPEKDTQERAEYVAKKFQKFFEDFQKEINDKDWWEENVTFMTSCKHQSGGENLARATFIAGKPDNLAEDCLVTIKRTFLRKFEKSDSLESHIEFLVGFAGSLLDDAKEALMKHERVKSKLGGNHSEKQIEDIVKVSILEAVCAELGITAKMGAQDSDGKVEIINKKEKKNSRPDF